LHAIPSDEGLVLIDVEDFMSHAEAIDSFKVKQKVVQLRQFLFHGLLIHVFILHQDKQISVTSFHFLLDFNNQMP
jgi:hypothetical protein